MLLNEINLNKICVDELLKAYNSKAFVSPTNKEKKEIHSKFADAIFKGKYIEARNCFLIGILFDLENTFTNIRKKGCFRFSNYINQKCIISSLIKEIQIVIEKEKIILDIKDVKYLESVLNFSSVHSSFNQLHEFILKEITYFKKEYPDKSILKSFLAYVDFLFITDYQVTDKLDVISLSSRSKEEISDGACYVIHLLNELYDFEKIDTTRISEEYILTHRIQRPLSAACLMADLKEFEILIDYFDYSCEYKLSILRILPPSPDFEKSIRLGYIRNEIQIVNDFMAHEDATSIDELVDTLNSKDFNLFEYTDTFNYPRYVIKIPELLYDYLKDNFFTNDGLFKEETSYLSHIFKEQLLDYDQLLKIHVKENLTLFEFLKIKRVFTFFQILFSKRVYETKGVKESVLLRSLVPVLKEEDLYSIFRGIVSEEKLDSFLDIVYWEQGSDKFLDLQYHSMIFLKNNFFIPLTVFVHSNAIRNLFASEYKQNNKALMKDGSIDPLVDSLSKTLTKAKLENYTNVNIKDGEIDVLAIYENKLIIFECKHSLNPTTVYELRTTYDYIKKANFQLDKINEKYVKGELLDMIQPHCLTDLSKIDGIFSVVILSNRMFNGNAFKYPIRNINEFENFILRGKFRTEEGEFWLWNTNTLSIQDMQKYFIENNPVLEHMNSELNKFTLKYEFNSPPIEFDTYNLQLTDKKESIESLVSKFRKVE